MSFPDDNCSVYNLIVAYRLEEMASECSGWQALVKIAMAMTAFSLQQSFHTSGNICMNLSSFISMQTILPH
jgi:hypothetical protein